jgi:hypothetical protein
MIQMKVVLSKLKLSQQEKMDIFQDILHIEMMMRISLDGLMKI